MSDLNIKELKIEEAKNMFNACSDFKVSFEITLKVDGGLLYYKDKNIYSKRCNRNERFKHILDILNENNFEDCLGEIHIEGGKVFDVSKRENWKKAKFMVIDFLNYKGRNLKKRQEEISEKIKEINNPFLIEMKKFNSFDEGWNYVKENNCEGLVLRKDNFWFKVKLLKEEKREIVEHEKGLEKGTFILNDGNRISATSQEFIIQYLEIKKRGNIPIAEVEYAFKTENNRMFQPRLRKIWETPRLRKICELTPKQEDFILESSREADLGI